MNRTPHIRRKTLDLPNYGPGLVAHRLVMSVALELAHELFEVYAADNNVYRALLADGQVTEQQARLAFVERLAPRLLEDARQTLTDMLALPDDRVSVSQKNVIADALIVDTHLRAKRFVAESNATIPSSVH